MGLKPRSVRVGTIGTQCLLVDRKGMDELKSQFMKECSMSVEVACLRVGWYLI